MNEEKSFFIQKNGILNPFEIFLHTTEILTWRKKVYSLRTGSEASKPKIQHFMENSFYFFIWNAYPLEFRGQ